MDWKTILGGDPYPELSIADPPPPVTVDRYEDRSLWLDVTTARNPETAPWMPPGAASTKAPVHRRLFLLWDPNAKKRDWQGPFSEEQLKKVALFTEVQLTHYRSQEVPSGVKTN